MKNVGIVPDHSWDGFFMDFGGNLAPSWGPKWSQNRYKMVLKKYEKMLMTRMAKKDLGGYGCVRHQGFGARGGGKEEG